MDKVSVNQMGYLGLGVSNIQHWEDFATDVLGMQSNGHTQDGALFLKMDNYHHRLVLHPNGKDDIAYVGWQVKDDDELDAMAKQLKAEGVEISYGSPQEARDRHVSGLIKMEDPSGVPTEIFYGPQVGYGKDFKSPRNITGFVTGNMGIGHIVLAVKDFEKSLYFYRRILGFRPSDPIPGPESAFRMAFMHCNPRHHSLGFVQARTPEGNQPYSNPGPNKRLQHIMIQTQSLDDVGSTYYLCQERGYTFSKELGRHNNDFMVSFYVIAPSGFGIEYGWGSREVDDSTWQVTQPGSTPWEHPQHTPPEKIREKPIISAARQPVRDGRPNPEVTRR